MRGAPPGRPPTRAGRPQVLQPGLRGTALPATAPVHDLHRAPAQHEGWPHHHLHARMPGLRGVAGCLIRNARVLQNAALRLPYSYHPHTLQSADRPTAPKRSCAGGGRGHRAPGSALYNDKRISRRVPPMRPCFCCGPSNPVGRRHGSCGKGAPSLSCVSQSARRAARAAQLGGMPRDTAVTRCTFNMLCMSGGVRPGRGRAARAAQPGSVSEQPQPGAPPTRCACQEERGRGAPGSPAWRPRRARPPRW